jgi:hypothetical protein
MGDADGTYDFRQIPQFLHALTVEGYDFVTGSRFLQKRVVDFCKKIIPTQPVSAKMEIYEQQ